MLREIPSELIRRAVYPALIRRWRPSARRYLRELQHCEFAPLAVIEGVQLDRIKRVVSHASANVPYYREVFAQWGIQASDIASREDFAKLPILAKSTVQSACNRFLAYDRPQTAGLPNASGGSTGKPVQFFQDAEYWDRAHATQAFVESWWGIRPGDRTASLWGADRDIPQQSWRERLYGEIAQLRVCNAFALNAAQMENFAKMLVKWQPRHVIGYASALEVFAKFLIERNETRIRPLAVKTTADVLDDDRRATIEKAFGCPVYNFYGSREINNLAVECPARQGLHVNSLTRYIEIVDDNGKPVPPRVPGRILLTDLTNYFMPFLRYEIEDIGSWTGTPCECGRPFPLLAKVWGRSSDFITTPEGKLIHGEYFTHLFYDLREVASFQLNQTSLNNVSVRVVLRPELHEYPASKLSERLREALGPQISFTVDVVPSIERPPSGKHRFTVSSVKPSWGPADSVLQSQGTRV